MAVVTGNPLQNLNMNDFLSKVNQLGNVAKSCRFAVQIFPRSGFPFNDLLYVCDAAELPGRGFDLTEVRYYGPSQVFPNNTIYQQTNLSFICRQLSVERRFFDDWMEFINPTSNFHFSYPTNYYSTINIYQLADTGSMSSATKSSLNTFKPIENVRPLTFEEERQLRIKEQSGELRAARDGSTAPAIIYGWTLRKAYPILVNPQQVTWADNDILRLQVVFTYKYWDRIDFRQQ